MKILQLAVFIAGLTACSVSTPRYIVSPTIMMYHSEVMSEDYPTKKAVFVKFGAPTSKETFDNIENWYFKLSEVTNTTSIGMSSGLGRIYQDPMNPYLRSVDKSLVTQQTQVTKQLTNSTTVETYVKFWFINDSVSKWEAFGVDYSRLIPNPNYDTEKGLAWEKAKMKQLRQTKNVVYSTLSFGILMFFALLIAGGS